MDAVFGLYGLSVFDLMDTVLDLHGCSTGLVPVAGVVVVAVAGVSVVSLAHQ
jgi:hypothetical protein